MKRLFFLIIPVVACLSCSPIIYTSVQPADGDEETEQVFYNDLTPYGEWINYPAYGYVWQPDVDAGFRPYATNGSWVYSDDYGWTWVSDYSWGWAPFHYGRWFYDNYYGWLWAPGNEWAPAWVTWGQSGDYYCWAPMPPGISPGEGWMPPDNDWNFVAAVNITNSNVNRYVIRRNASAINRVAIINDRMDNGARYRYNRGPVVNEVERYGHSVRHVGIRFATKPGQSRTGDQIQIYRPAIKQGGHDARPAPDKAVNYNHNDNQGRPVGNPRQGNNEQNQPGRRDGGGKPANRPGNNTGGQTDHNGNNNIPGRPVRDNESSQNNRDGNANSGKHAATGQQQQKATDSQPGKVANQQNPPQKAVQGYRAGSRADSGKQVGADDNGRNAGQAPPQRPVIKQNADQPNKNRPGTTPPANNGQRVPAKSGSTPRTEEKDHGKTRSERKGKQQERKNSDDKRKADTSQ